MNSKVMMVPVETRVGYYGDETLKFNWNDDIMTEILPRLPAKSVARFKVVCKGWLSYLSSEKFCRRHTLCHPKLQPSLILKMDDSQYYYFNPIMNDEKLMIRPYSFSVPHDVVCSCNGLMLLESDDAEPSFHMYNPTTRQSRVISITNPYTVPYIVAIAIAFDPSESPHYKIVCFRCTTKAGTNRYVPHIYHIEVYDSESRSWKLTLGPFMFHRKIHFHHEGVYWNGSIYWEVCYYDIAKNEFKTLPLPDSPLMKPQAKAIYIGPSILQVENGNLYHTKTVTKDDVQSVAVFELQLHDDRCCWLLKYHRTISRYEATSFLGHPQQLRFNKGSYGRETETCCFVFYMSGKIIAYDFLDESSKVLVDLTVQPFNQAKDAYEELQRFEFGECLALV